MGFMAIRMLHVSFQRNLHLLDNTKSHLPIMQAIRAKDPALARARYEEAMEVWRRDILEYAFSEPAQAGQFEYGILSPLDHRAA